MTAQDEGRKRMSDGLPILEGVKFILDGREVEARPGETIWQVASRHGTDIPHLCYSPAPGYRPDGNCRACMVEVEGERVLAASCVRRPTPGMKVQTASQRAATSRKLVFELLVADQPERAAAHDPNSAFWGWADRIAVTQSRFPAIDRVNKADDFSHPAMAVQLDACIHCNLCVRACREVQVNDVIGMAARGHLEKIVFDFDDPMGSSTCVACGECVQACPTGALMEKSLVDEAGVFDVANAPEREVDSVCPYCGVGCQLTYRIKDDRIVAVDGRDGPSNQNRLCVKGRFGFDYVHHPDRLTKPMIRKDGVSKHDTAIDPADPWTHFREATWDEALERAAGGLKRIRDRDGGNALAGFGSAKGSNEEAYLFQKLVRAGFSTNNVDHCTRLCHASSVAGLLEGVGSGAVSAPFMAAEDADVIVVIGANPIENHPVAATFFKNAAERGAKLVVMDPRGQALKRHATHMLQFRPGRDVAMLNAMLHTIVEEKLYDRQYVQANTEDFEKLVENVRDFPPETMAEICGIPAKTLREVARLYARAEAAIIFWGMGVSQHVHGTDNTRCLIALALCDRPDRAPRHGPAPPARPEQRAGRLRRRPHPDVLPRLQAGRGPGDARLLRGALGREARPEARAHRRRDHGRGPCRQDPRHVHHGREPGDVGPGRAARPRGAGEARAPRRPGHLPDRDREIRRRHPAGLGLAREGRHGHEHQSSSPDRPQGAAAAGRGAARSRHHHRSRPPPRHAVELRARQRGLRRDDEGDAVAREHHLGAARARELRHLPGRFGRRARARHRLRRRLPDGVRARQVRAGARSCRRPRSRTPSTRSCSPRAGSSSTGTPAR